MYWASERLTPCLPTSEAIPFELPEPFRVTQKKFCYMPISYEYEQMDTSVFVSCIRLLPTVLAGCPEGCNTSAYWGFSAQTSLCGSENPLIGYGISRFVEISVLAPASYLSHIVEPCASSAIDDAFFLNVGKLQWTDGLKER